MPHEAFSLVDVVRPADLEGERLSALTYLGDLLFLGTAAGRLLQFRVSSRAAAVGAASGAPEYAAARERAVDVGSSRAPVAQLEVMPDVQLLVALCDGGVSLHRLASLDRVPSVLDAKHAVAFAVNARARKLCVVTSKRRLRLYEWVDGRFAPLRSHPELDVPDVPRALVYYGPRVCLGYSREYNVLFEDTGEVKEVGQAMGKDTRSLVKLLPGDALVVVCANETGVVVSGATGEPSVLAAGGDRGSAAASAAASAASVAAAEAANSAAGGAAGGGAAAAGAGVAILQFRHRPLALGYCFPYIVSVGDGLGAAAGPACRVEVHAGRGGKDETVQTLQLPAGGVAAMADGRVGSTSKLDVDAMDLATKGRNPLYIAMAHPGRILRLQPVPVDRQVEDMARQFCVSSAVDLIVNTCPSEPPSLLPARLARLNIDAGRVFFLGLHFEQAFPFLQASPIDPRELLHMFPDLLPGSTTLLLQPSAEAAVTAAAAAAARARQPLAAAQQQRLRLEGRQARARGAGGALDGDDLGELGLDDALPLYAPTPSRFFSVSLTQGIASGLKQPGEAASEAADARGAADPSGVVTVAARGGAGAGATAAASASSAEAAGAGGFTEGSGRVVQTGVADVSSIVRGQLAAFAARVRGASGGEHGEDFARSDLAVGAPQLSLLGAGQDGRVRAAYEGLLPFLRQRRCAIAAALRAAVTSVPTAAFISSGGASAGASWDSADEGGRVPAHTVLVVRDGGGRKVFAARGSAFSVSSMSQAELLVLAGVVDSALMKLFAALGMATHLDRFLFRPNQLDVADAVGFLASQARFRSLALFFAGRGMAREALSTWRDLGLGVSVERPVANPAGPALSTAAALRRRARRLSAASGADAEDGEVGGGGGQGGSAGERRRRPLRRDSLSDLEDALSHPAFLAAAAVLPADAARAPPAAAAAAAMAAAACAAAPSQTCSGLGIEAAGAADVAPLAVALAGQALGVGADGVADSISFLRASGDQSLVFEFCAWLLLGAAPRPQQAMAVFTTPSPLRARPLLDDAVLDFLSAPRFADVARRAPASGAARMFLEHLVFARGRAEERYHTRLAREYVASVLQLRGDASPAAGAGAGSAISARLALIGTVADRPAPGSEGGMLGAMRARLLSLLQNSDRYDARELLALVRDSNLFEERVVLCGRLGLHERALSLLVSELADADRAVLYCELQVQLRSAAAAAAAAPRGGTDAAALQGSAQGAAGALLPPQPSPDPFLCLLRLYLEAHLQHARTPLPLPQPPPPPQPLPGAARPASSVPAAPVSSAEAPATHSVFLTRALGVLSEHAHDCDALAAARLLPGALPLHRLLGYCARVLPASAHAAREAAAVKHLYNFRYLEVHDRLISSQERSTTVSRATVCHVCDKRIGDAVFAVLPDGRPVHFHCSREVAAFSGGEAAAGGGGAARARRPAAAARMRLYELPAQRGDGQLLPLPRRAAEVEGAEGDSEESGEQEPQEQASAVRSFVVAPSAAPALAAAPPARSRR